MAFTFNKIEAVQFGDLVTKPQMTQEMKMRVSALRLTPDNLNKAIEVLAACFGEDAAAVKAFMEGNMFIYDLAKLQAYLLGGDSGVKELEKKMDILTEKQMEDAYEALKARKASNE